jgi:hypothetical protein
MLEQVVVRHAGVEESVAEDGEAVRVEVACGEEAVVVGSGGHPEDETVFVGEQRGRQRSQRTEGVADDVAD